MIKNKRKAATRRIKFDAKQVLKMYNKGTNVADIAVAMGYARGHGQNRCRAVLLKAGVYKPVRSITSAPVVAATGKRKGGAITTAEQYAREAYSVVENRYHKLVGRARSGFPELVMGMIATGIGATHTVKVQPVALGSGLRLIHGGKKAA